MTFGDSSRRIPLYVLDVTEPDAWASTLDAAENDPENVPVGQLRSKHTVLTDSLHAALKYRDEDVRRLLRTYDDIVRTENTVAGQPGPHEQDRVSPLLYYVSEGEAGTNPNAYTFRVHWPADLMEEMLTTKGLRRSWGMWHELGHLHQQAVWEWEQTTEVTVNVYSLAVQRMFGEPSRLEQEGHLDKARAFLERPDGERDFADLAEEPCTMLVMFEQLRMAFGDEFYATLHRLAREERTVPDDEGARKRFLMVVASRAAHTDLIGFFERWGFTVDERTRSKVARLKLPRPARDVAALGL
ncbi:M60 family metallopeptidase [Streptomyces monticola]|uniref:M60 family metallopeptidase n=1 Tax=Streptomyces monticola TaxID=2666263 RepID=A0ABW2JFV8_9ACTN